MTKLRSVVQVTETARRSTARATSGGIAKTLLMALALSTGLAGQGTGAPSDSVLRVCADPGNPPFTNSDPARRGIYLDFAEALAAAMGRRMEPIWWDQLQGKRSVRSTLLAGACDLYIGLPSDSDFMGRSIIFSKPLLEEGFALVIPKGQTIRSLADLRGKRVAVQFATQPQIAVALADDIEGSTFRFPEEAMEALAAGKVDAALIWGPSAGWLNKTALGGAYDVVPLAGERMQFPVGIAFRKQDVALRDEVNSKLPDLQGLLDRLKESYGFPTGTPVRLAAAESEPTRLAAAEPAAAAAPPAPPVAGAPPAAEKTGTASSLDQGRELFASNCSHCHGPNAVTPEKRSNLRVLKKKYAERMDEVFHVTVKKGRPAKGMPAWEEALSDEDIAAIKAFIDTVQED